MENYIIKTLSESDSDIYDSFMIESYLSIEDADHFLKITEDDYMHYKSFHEWYKNRNKSIEILLVIKPKTSEIASAEVKAVINIEHNDNNLNIDVKFKNVKRAIKDGFYDEVISYIFDKYKDENLTIKVGDTIIPKAKIKVIN